MAELLYGKKVAQTLRSDIKKEIGILERKYSKQPILAAVVIGENPALASYVKAQKEVASEVGIKHKIFYLKSNITKKEISANIRDINADRDVNAVFISTPLPRAINITELITSISADKDAEGIHPENLGRLLSGNSLVAPCTACACIKLLESYKISVRGKNAVVVGHSEIVGKPLALMLLNRFATTTVCHIATYEAGKLAEHVRVADILFSAVGKAGLIKGDWIKKGAVVVDVGINKSGDKICGDVEFDSAEENASYITPVPGGVGPLTVTMLMKNCLELFKKQVGS